MNITVFEKMFNLRYILPSLITSLTIIWIQPSWIQPSSIFAESQKSTGADIIPVPISAYPLGCDPPTLRFNPNQSPFLKTVYCYPSSGGAWIASLTAVELSYLGIDRFNTSYRFPDQTAENAFCNTLRLFGGRWVNPSWINYWTYSDCRRMEILDYTRTDFTISRYVGFPSRGGVYVLELDFDWRWGDRIEPVKFEVERKVKRQLQLILSMDEQAMALQNAGARHCPDIWDCPALRDINIEPNKWVQHRKKELEEQIIWV